MSVIITPKGSKHSYIDLVPPMEGDKGQLINHDNVVRVRLLDIPSELDIVKIHLADGDVIELHFAVGVTVDGQTATSNAHLVTLLNEYLKIT